MKFHHAPSLIAAVLGLLLTLAACGPIHLVSDYDEQIDTGLTQANTDITAFVDKMIAAAGTPDGEYQKNKDFYTSEKAKLGSIHVRAEAHKVLNSCPTAAVIRLAVMTSVPEKKIEGPIPTLTRQEVLAQLPADDCGVVLISLIEGAFGKLETFHRAQAAMGIPAFVRGPILDGGLGSLIRSAIKVEVAKKAGQTKGGG